MNFIIFLFWPFAGLMRFIHSLRYNFSNLNFTPAAFYATFGLTLVYSESHDASRYAQYLSEKASLPFSSFFDLFYDILQGIALPDFFLRLIEFIISRFTTNEYVEFTILGGLLGFALFKLIAGVKGNQSLSSHSFFFVLFILLLLNPMRLLSIRHYLATSMLVYGLFQVYIHGRHKYLFLILTTVFVHFSFSLVLPFLLLPFVFKNRNYVYFILIVLAFYFSSEVNEWLINNISGLEGSVDQNFRGYTSEKYLLRKNELLTQSLSIITYLPNMLRYTFFLILYWVHQKVKQFDSNDLLYSQTLCIFLLLTLFSQNSVVADRFSVTYAILGCIYCIHHFKFIKSSSYFIKFIALFSFAWSFIVIGRQLLEFTNVLLFLPFSPLAYFIEDNQSIIEFIR